MKIMQCLTTATLMLWVASAAADTWTSKNGSTLEADFVKEKSGIIHLKTPDGAIKKIKKSDLSSADQKKATQLASPFAAKKAAEAKAATPKASDAILELFGQKLNNNKKQNVLTDELAGKIVGIYFSAHWCPPCKTFTPQLVKFHKEVTEKGKAFEIVFVSADRSKSEMYNYVEEAEMPWLMLPFGNDHKDSLSEKYEIKGIPSLIIIDAQGNTITKDGRGDVSNLGADAFEKWEN